MNSTVLLIVAVVLFALVLFQLAKTTEFVSILKGDEKTRLESDRIHARFFLLFLILGLAAMFWSVGYFRKDMVLNAASMHGQWIDSMFNVTLFFTAIVFVLTQIALFYFAWRFKHREGAKAYYYPENNKLEMWWTIIPAIVLTTLVVIGLYRWFQITGPEPKDSSVIEITGRQFNWMLRYPGQDGKLGNNEFKYVDDINVVGMDFTDPASKDDFMPNEMHLVVNKPVLLRIRSRDVIHDVGIPYFRVKMDAVPGITTRFWFVPITTTVDMRFKNGNPDFNYEIACDQLCGKGHFSMKMNVVVETQEEYNKWAASQPSFYDSAIKGTETEKKFTMLSSAGTNSSVLAIKQPKSK
ncbi:MAG: cytochrome c oxidase subunit II [Chitinophagales bacterium]|nr:cytochrome c oxidase subunit II [Chitinophagales bacterium]